MKLFFEDHIAVFMHQSDLRIENSLKKRIAHTGLKPQQTLIMMLLWEKDGLNQNEISEKLNKDKTNIARMLQSLELKGLIRRVSDGEDWRSLSVYLTNEGHDLSNILMPIITEFNEELCSGISTEELLILRKILSKMCDNIK